MENTNIATGTFGYVFGPPPVVPNEASGEYFQKFLDTFGWRLGSAAFMENFRIEKVGEFRMQFHLNSNGSINDLIILTNTIGDEMGKISRMAASGKMYESWPGELRQRQFAGYFTVRFLILCDYPTNFPQDFKSTLGLGRLTGAYPPGLKEIVKKHFEADPAYLLTGIAQMHTNNYPEALVNFTKAVGWDPGDAWAYSGLGYCLGSLKDFDGAMTNVSKALELDPENAGAWSSLALVKTHFKDYAGAVSAASRAIALNPEFAQAYRDRAYAKKRLQDFSGALADAEDCVRLAPTNALAFITRSMVRYCLGDYENALLDCNRGIDLNPRDAAFYGLRGDVQQAQQSPTAALASFDKALEIDPKLYYARFKAWILRCEAGDAEGATKELKGDLESRPDKQRAEWSYQVEAFLAGSLSEDDFLSAASSSAKTTRERTEQLCEANYYAGVKRLFAGDKQSAADFFQRSIATGVRDFGEYIRARDELKALQNVTSASK